MEKASKRVSKRHMTLPVLAVVLATILTYGSNQVEEQIEVVDYKAVEFNPLLNKAIQEYNNLEQKWIEEQQMIRVEANIAKAKQEVKMVEAKKVESVKVKPIKAVKVVRESKSYSEEDLYWLSRVVSSEAKGESEKGQIAVANVVLNRVRSGNFEDTIKGVVFQKKQFSGVYDKSIYKEPTKEAIESAKKALEGKKVIDDNVYYFYNPKTATSRWLDSRKVAVDIGGHRFTY